MFASAVALEVKLLLKIVSIHSIYLTIWGATQKFGDAAIPTILPTIKTSYEILFTIEVEIDKM